MRIRRASTVETLTVRGMTHGLRRWRGGGPPLVLLHGVRDSAATFQFLVDALAEDWDVYAPDWRGHGHSAHADSYWLHDLVGDLDALMRKLFAGTPVRIVGHSLGGNVAGLYAGLRPERVSALVSLDAFGPLLHHAPVDATALLHTFLDVAANDAGHRGFADPDALVARLRAANARLTLPQARFLVAEGAVQGADGLWRWRFDRRLRRSLPSLRTIEEWQAIWARTTAPLLWLASSDTRANAPGHETAEFAARAAAVPHLSAAVIPASGHNLHHDQPRAVAAAIEGFLKIAV